MTQQTMPRRAALALPSLLLPRLAAAQPAPFPSHPVTLIVGFSPGGGTDILCRLLAPKLTEEFGQPVAVENRTGAAGTLAAAATARARPDGHTMTMGTVSGNVVAPLSMRPPPFDPVRDLTPVMLVASVPLVAVVPAGSPVRSIADLTALARARPGGLNFSSNGPGSSMHIAAEIYMRETGTRMTHVPGRGSAQSMQALLSGQVDVVFDTLSTTLPFLRQGTLRGLAVTTAARSDWVPELPTMAEAGVPGFDIDVWYMLYGPRDLPAPVAERWAAALTRALTPPEMRRRLRDAGFDVRTGTPAEAAALVRAEVERYGALLRAAGIPGE